MANPEPIKATIDTTGFKEGVAKWVTKMIHNDVIEEDVAEIAAPHSWHLEGKIITRIYIMRDEDWPDSPIAKAVAKAIKECLTYDMTAQVDGGQVTRRYVIRSHAGLQPLIGLGMKTKAEIAADSGIPVLCKQPVNFHITDEPAKTEQPKGRKITFGEDV